jgi:FkbH-like protein
MLILADFNAANFANYLAHDTSMPRLEARIAPARKGHDLLRRGDADDGSDRDLFVWTQPHNISDGFAGLLDGDDPDVGEIMSQVDGFARAVAAAAAGARVILVPTWVTSRDHRGFGLSAMRHEAGIANVLMRMNLRLAEQLRGCDNVFLLDTQRWLRMAGSDAYNPRLWHMAKIPFGNGVCKIAVAETKAALRAIAGESRKLVVVDLDNTLWGGVLGDEGWENLRVGGHDAAGEAHAAFQRDLKCLARRGIMLGIVSKNDEALALDALARHPEMQLRIGDFAGWRINWSDKADNVAALTAELNLGLQSVVFIDDNPAERARVREALPEVLVPEWPATPLLFPSALADLDCFDTPVLTAEDRARQAAYRTERSRLHARAAVGSEADWLASLELKVEVSDLNAANLPRITQLFNKTNQMNLSTRRLTAAELSAWAAMPGHRLWAFRVKDRFEDAGVTGILSVTVDGDEARIVDFVLSCRVMGRGVEDAMLHHAAQHARSLGLSRLSAEYVPTARNAPSLRFLQRSGFENGDGHLFRWRLDRPYERPPHLELEVTVGG